MIALLFWLWMLDEPELIPIPKIVATLKAEKESLAHLARSRRLTITPGTEVLGAMRKHGTKMVPALKELLIDESPLVRKNGVFALGYLNDLVAEWEIIPLLEDKDLSVRILVAENLTMLQDKVVRNALLGALEDDVPEMRKRVIHRLGLYGQENPLRKEISNYDRAAMIDALGKLVHDPDTDVRDYLRRETALALGKIRDERSVESLIKAFIAETEQAYLMVPPLGAFNDSRVIQPLVNKMFSDPDNPYLADAVVEVLERIQHPDAIGIPVEAAIAYPGTFAGFAIRRMTGHRFDAEAFERWWHERKGLYEAAK